MKITPQKEEEPELFAYDLTDLFPLCVQVLELNGDVRHQTLPQSAATEESLARLVDVVTDVLSGWQLSLSLLRGRQIENGFCWNTLNIFFFL